MELASACGHREVKPKDLNRCLASSCGLGVQVMEAQDCRMRRPVLDVGGERPL
ncbi:MAG: hypothetical protein LBR80_01800 [Deltaproteobacteria bacterium]|nr:hypothetical protein [Deltaproteobacteria bacterium]